MSEISIADNPRTKLRLPLQLNRITPRSLQHFAGSWVAARSAIHHEIGQ